MLTTQHGINLMETIHIIEGWLQWATFTRERLVIFPDEDQYLLFVSICLFFLQTLSQCHNLEKCEMHGIPYTIASNQLHFITQEVW